MTSSPSERSVALITGASSGIGAALAVALAPTHDLMLVARREGALQEVAAAAEAAAPGSRVRTAAADVTDRGAVTQLVPTTLAELGRLDVWVNNVGRGITRMPSALTDEDLDDMLRINVKTALYGMQAVLPYFQGTGTGQIVNVSSMLGRMPMALPRAAYSAAKHFLNAITANFRSEVQATHPGIQVTLVSPGVVRTDFGTNALHGGPDSRTLPDSQSAEEVAAVIVAAIRGRLADAYTRPGSAVRVTAYVASLGADPVEAESPS